MNWYNNTLKLAAILGNLSVRDKHGRELHHDESFSRWRDLTVEIRNSGLRVFLIGNGASANVASHSAVDLAKNGRIRTEIFTDVSLITAIANDISYEQIFVEPLMLKMIEGDMLVAISSSGNSQNVLRGAETARNLGGIVITLSAMKSENALKKLGDLNFYVPAQTYGFAETGHAAVLLFWIDQVIGDMR